MANRNFENVKRMIANISEDTYKTAEQGGGGVIKVDELPEVGEEHTVYELTQEIAGNFPYLFTEIDPSKLYLTSDRPVIVVENEEDVNFDNLQMETYPENSYVVVYVTTTNKVYKCYWYSREVPYADPFEKDEIFPEAEGTYKYPSSKASFAILKDFDYAVDDSGETPRLVGVGHFLDGTEFNYVNSNNVVPLVLTNATNKLYLLHPNGLYGAFECQFGSSLPTAKEAVDNHMVAEDGQLIYPIIIDNVACMNSTSGDDYYWDSDQQKFGVIHEEADFQEYTGPLEWVENIIKVVNKIDLSLINTYSVFAPQSAHAETSYWYYSNGKWINMDKSQTTNSCAIINVEGKKFNPAKFLTLMETKLEGTGMTVNTEVYLSNVAIFPSLDSLKQNSYGDNICYRNPMIKSDGGCSGLYLTVFNNSILYDLLGQYTGSLTDYYTNEEVVQYFSENIIHNDYGSGNVLCLMQIPTDTVDNGKSLFIYLTEEEALSIFD